MKYINLKTAWVLDPQCLFLLLYSTFFGVKKVLPALGKEENLQTRRSVWDVSAASHSPHRPLLCP